MNMTGFFYIIFVIITNVKVGDIIHSLYLLYK